MSETTTHYTTIATTGESVVDADTLARAYSHAIVSAELLEKLHESSCSRLKMDLSAARQKIGKHHYRQYKSNNEQRDPSEDDQRHLDELTESLMHNLFPTEV